MSKKRILLLSDDLRMTSGISTMSKEFVKLKIKELEEEWINKYKNDPYSVEKENFEMTLVLEGAIQT
jgi:hypothetical protein